MIIKFKTLGSIEYGDVFLHLDGQRLQCTVNKVSTFGNKYYEGVHEVSPDLKSVIFTVEKDGLVLDRYDLTVEQAIDKYNGFYLEKDIESPGQPYRELNVYTVPLYATPMSWRYAFEREALEAVIKLVVLRDWATTNPREVNAEGIAKAIDILKPYCGSLLDLQDMYEDGEL